MSSLSLRLLVMICPRNRHDVSIGIGRSFKHILQNGFSLQSTGLNNITKSALGLFLSRRQLFFIGIVLIFIFAQMAVITKDINQFKELSPWGRVTHICVGDLTIIGSDIGLSPGRCPVNIWTNAGILFIVPLGTNFSEVLIHIQIFSFTKSSWKYRLQNGVYFVSASMC